MSPHPSNGSEMSQLDLERKEELIMEKKLRACRVNIIPRSGGYLRETSLPPPVTKRPAPPPVSPEAVIKASNPIALRYWNQCTAESNQTTNTETKLQVPQNIGYYPPWASEGSLPTSPVELIPKLPPKTLKVPNISNKMGYSRQTPCDDPNPKIEKKNPSDNTEIVKVLSTAGTGIKRNNEVMEALGSINRFITVDKVQKSDAERVSHDTERFQGINKQENDKGCSYKESYQEIKEEEIRKSQQRAKFMNNSEKIRIPNSPRPFQDQSLSRENKTKCETCGNDSVVPNTPDSPADLKKLPDVKHILSEIIPNLKEAQTTQLGPVLFSQMPTDTAMEIVAQQLSVMSGTQMASILGCLENQVISTAVPVLFAKTKSEVKKSLIGGTLANMEREEKLDLLIESEDEIPDLIEGMIEKLGYSSRQRMLKSLLEKEEMYKQVNYPVPEIRVENTSITNSEDTYLDPEQLNWGWDNGEEYEFYECNGGREPMDNISK